MDMHVRIPVVHDLGELYRACLRIGLRPEEEESVQVITIIVVTAPSL